MGTNKYYGRKWEVRIVCTDGTRLSFGSGNTMENPTLRVLFDVNYPGYEAWYYSEVIIYNFAKETEQKVINEGGLVEIFAGYLEGDYGLIFSGYVFQSIVEREGVTDWKLTLRCIDGDKIFDKNICAFTLSKGYTQSTLINHILSRAQTPIPIGGISSNLKKTKAVRATTIFMPPAVKLREVARYNTAHMYVNQGKINIAKMTDEPQGEAIVISPNTGLIGTPQQIDYGVTFKCLLNPSINLTYPFKWVKLDMTFIRQQKAIQGKRTSILDQDGLYLIAGVRYVGDSRGQDWYNEVTGLTRAGKTPLQIFFPSYMTTKDSDI